MDRGARPRFPLSGAAIAGGFFIGTAPAQTIDWVQHYNGPAVGASQFDLGNAVALDGYGNVVIAGQSQSDTTGADIVTLKYDADGVPLWVQRYNGPANAADVAFAVAVDLQGAIFVCGASTTAGIDQDYITLKYAPDGTLLWEARTSTSGFPLEQAKAIVIAANGDAIVTGQSAISDFIGDCLTVRYDGATGSALWSQRFTTPGSRFDRGNAVVVDPSNDETVVIGQAESSTTFADVLAIRYACDGTQLWLTTWSSAGAHTDRGIAAAMAADGGILVTGDTIVQSPDVDFLTLRFEPGGSVGWVRTFGGAALNADRGLSIVVDAVGVAYVAGSSRTIGGNDDFQTLAYDTGGNLLWSRSYDGPGTQADVARAIRLDTLGGVYVGGESRGVSSDVDMAVVKYDTAGNFQWEARYTGPENRADFLRGLAVDKCGNAYAAGYVTSTNPSDTNIATLKVIPSSPNRCATDITGDGLIGLDDLTVLLAEFGTTGYIAPADVDCNGRVDLNDLTLVLATFGSACP